MRRVIPAANYEQFLIHHAVDKAQHRRPRNEILNARELHSVITQKTQQPITMHDAYDTHVYNQYNLGLMDVAAFQGKSLWSWGVEEEEAAG
jgi:hypothetical protein